MNQIRVTYLLTFLFAISIATPTIILYSNTDVEISQLLEKGEEEENKGKEPVEDQEFKILNINFYQLGIHELENQNKSDFYMNDYQNDYVKITSPPPEHIL